MWWSNCNKCWSISVSSRNWIKQEKSNCINFDWWSMFWVKIRILIFFMKQKNKTKILKFPHQWSLFGMPVLFRNIYFDISALSQNKLHSFFFYRKRHKKGTRFFSSMLFIETHSFCFRRARISNRSTYDRKSNHFSFALFLALLCDRHFSFDCFQPVFCLPHCHIINISCSSPNDTLR